LFGAVLIADLYLQDFLCRPFVDYASTKDIIGRVTSPKNDSGK
jgi:hypothetical protein